jgi:uncharacterized DUF497 family protein
MYGVHMIRFEWSPAKNRSNLQKHEVTFEEAVSIFYDELGVQFFDCENSTDEDRFIMLGISNKGRLLIVSHCEKDAGATIRIISARKATNSESQSYKRAST